MKHILIVTTIYRCGERMYPIIPKLAESYKVSLLTLYQMHRGGRYLGWNGTTDMRDTFDNEYSKYFENHWTGEVYGKGLLDVSQFDAIIQDDCRSRSGMDILYREAKEQGILVFGNQHGGNNFNPDWSKPPTEHGGRYPLTGIESNFDKCFFYGQYEFDYYTQFADEKHYLLGGFPSNDKLGKYERTNEHILVITNFLGNNPKRRFRGREFNERFVERIGLKEIQEKYNKPVLVKVKSRLHDAPSYEIDKRYVSNVLSQFDIEGEVVFDVEDDNKLICDSICVVGAASTMMYKPIQKGIPTVMIKGSGWSDFFGDFPGILDWDKELIIRELERQETEGKDVKYLEYIIHGSSDYTSTEKYVEHIKRLV